MKNRQLVILLITFLFSAGMVACPPCGFTQEAVTIDGMVQIDRNHIYMIAAGSDMGLAKGDIVEVYRLNVKVAEARLISVLPDSSMAEMLKFINITDVYESDSVRYVSNLKVKGGLKQTLSTDQKEVKPDISVSVRGREKRGLLGSDTSIDRQVSLAREPLEKEVAGLKVGMETLKEDYEGKMDVVLDTVVAGRAKSVVNVEKKWRNKFDVSNKEHEEQLMKQRAALEAEYAKEKESLQKRIEALTRQISEAGETGDKRTRQLMGDLKDSGASVNMLRETFEKERTLEEGRWLEKIGELEQRYQNQLRIQKGDYERQIDYNNKEYQGQIAEFQSQILQLQKSNKVQAETVEERLKGRQSVISSLKAEKFDLEEEVNKKNIQIVNTKKDALDLKDELAKTKSSYGERMKAAKRPLETEIEDLKKKLVDSQKSYESKLSAAENRSKESLLAAKEEGFKNAGAIESKLQMELNALKGSSEGQIKQLRSTLEDRDKRVALLEKNRDEQAAKLSQNEKEIKQLGFNVQTLKAELAGETASRSKVIEDETQSLKKEVMQLNDEIISLSKDYERQIETKSKEDGSVIKFLNDEMATMTGDLENQEKLITKLEKDSFRLKKDLEKSKGSVSDKIMSTKKPLEEKISKLVEELDATKKSYEKQMNDLQAKASDGLLASQEQFQAKLIEEAKRHQEEVNAIKAEAEGKIAALGEQVDALRGDSDSAISELQSRLEKKEAMVKSLEETNSKINADLQKKSGHLAELENNVAQLNESLSETKLSNSEKIKFAKLSLGDKISELNDELIATKRKHIAEINDLKESGHNETKELKNQLSENNLLIKSLQDTNSKMSTDLQSANELNEQLSAFKGNSDAIARNLQDQLDEKETQISSLDKKNSGLVSELEKKNEQLAKLEENVSQLSLDFNEAKSSLSNKIKYAKLPLEENINTLNREMVAMEKKHHDEIEDIKKEAGDKLLKAEKESIEKSAGREAQWEEKLENVRGQFKEEIASLNKQLEISRDGSDKRTKGLDEELQREKRAVASLKLDATNLQLDLSEKDRRLAKYEREVEELKEKLTNENFSTEKRITLAKESMAAEIKMLRSELAFARDNHQENSEFLKERALNDIRVSEEKAKAELGALEAQWKVKWATREEEYRQEMIALKNNSENQLSGNRGELKKVIMDLNDRLAMLKNSSDNQIKELEDELVAREYQLGLRDGEYQKRMTDIESRWALKLAEEQKKYKQDFEEKNQQNSEDFLKEKKELRQTVIDLTDELRKLRDSSAKRIAGLEADLDKREFKLGFMENNTQQNTFEVEEKWRAKLTAIEEKYKRELINQKHDIEARYSMGNEKQQSMIDGLTSQIESLKGQFRVDLALKDEKLAAEIALIEGKHQKELANLGGSSNKELEEQIEKGKYQQGLIDALKRDKSTLDNELKQKERDLASARFSIEGYKKQQALIDDLTSQIGSLKEQFRVDLALKDQKLAAEIALLENKHQKELADLGGSSNKELALQIEKVRFQQGLIDALERDKSALDFDLKQNERDLANTKALIEGLRKENKMVEVSQSERMRLSMDAANAKIGDLSAQLAAIKNRAVQDQMDLEDRWKEKLAKAEESYIEKLNAQRKNLENDVRDLTHRLDASVNDTRGSTEKLRDELEDNQTLIQSLGREKYDLTARLDRKDREIVMLNEDIINLKENLERYKGMVSSSSSIDSAQWDQLGKSDYRVVAPKSDAWYNESDSAAEYHSIVRKAIFSKFQEFDFSSYAGKADIVKIDFELFADGSPKEGPKFIGTEDEGLKDLLMKCFKGAAPFPPFPKDLKKLSQRFALSVSFKK